MQALLEDILTFFCSLSFSWIISINLIVPRRSSNKQQGVKPFERDSKFQKTLQWLSRTTTRSSRAATPPVCQEVAHHLRSGNPLSGVGNTYGSPRRNYTRSRSQVSRSAELLRETSTKGVVNGSGKTHGWAQSSSTPGTNATDRCSDYLTPSGTHLDLWWTSVGVVR